MHQMMSKGNMNFADKEMISDALTSQKYITENYNVFANECVTQNMKNDFMNILAEEHDIAFDLFKDMQSRGWYQVEQAPQQKVDQARQKFQGSMG